MIVPVASGAAATELQPPVKALVRKSRITVLPPAAGGLKASSPMTVLETAGAGLVPMVLTFKSVQIGVYFVGSGLPDWSWLERDAADLDSEPVTNRGVVLADGPM